MGLHWLSSRLAVTADFTGERILRRARHDASPRRFLRTYLPVTGMPTASAAAPATDAHGTRPRRGRRDRRCPARGTGCSPGREREVPSIGGDPEDTTRRATVYGPVGAPALTAWATWFSAMATVQTEPRPQYGPDDFVRGKGTLHRGFLEPVWTLIEPRQIRSDGRMGRWAGGVRVVPGLGLCGRGHAAMVANMRAMTAAPRASRPCSGR